MFGLDYGWAWAIGGLVLLIAEVIAPGFFLFFIGVAAVATGLAALTMGFGLTAQVVLFAILAALAVLVGKRFYARPNTPNTDPFLNERAQRMVGRSVKVVDPVDANGGRVKVGDGEWSARGGPAAAGETVVITGVDGNCLTVEAPPRV
ncbi:NfeD family protein [Sphingomonas sp. ASV193]|uniref:NfeD family protein n=1 Tax=Sphingomonas sp. ASV193 TaxID=3144405 RepID=UPI0032E8B217